MPFVVAPSRNATTQLAFALLDGKPAKPKAPAKAPPDRKAIATKALKAAEKKVAKKAPAKKRRSSK